ncbi:excisionase [Streptomyces lunaelactis]|uniref:Excisionase n=1 Tax=Streptomyces lunaelactis TaxID=1535768 RepID=A0A2R4T588_9ACTN|nr:helix-turn-helix domain-containing protein [Streptomyces lunaelactis]AVZ74309.1 excisionase [Streptomyces lunaelactis]NUK85728.1 helix-turn-helix domain-containing protein [Streptomyces lunaelactis]
MLEPHLSVREAAVFLGGERFVRRLIAERRITYIKDQRRVLIPESAVIEFLAARTVPALVSRTRRRRAA